VQWQASSLEPLRPLTIDRFQARVTAPTAEKNSRGDQEEPSSEKTADAIARVLIGKEIQNANKPLAGQAVHYALGIGLGVAYGVAAEFRPSVTAGSGAAFGVVVATLLDETAVPASGLGEVPWKAGLTSNLYAYASHLVFGGTAELVRRQVAGTLRA
jgi:putative membrane protein